MNLADKDVLTFDCYGTLIDWETGILQALTPVLTAHGIAIEPDSLLERYGALEAACESGPYQPYRDVLRSVLDQLGAQFGFTPAPAEREILVATLPDWPPFPDTIESLHRLRRTYKLAIVSNTDDSLFAATQRRLSVPFDWIVTAEQARSYKPSRNNFHVALERMGLPPERVLHVAQSLYHDIVPAKELGLNTVWVNRRHDKAGAGASPPAQVRPDMEVPDLKTLADLLGHAGTGP